MEPPVKAIRCGTAILAEEARKLTDALSNWKPLSTKEKAELIDKVEHLSYKIFEAQWNQGAVAAFRCLGEALPKTYKDLKERFSSCYWVFLKDLMPLIVRYVDRPFTLMRISKGWRAIALESVVQDIERSVPQGYFGHFEKENQLPQLVEFRRKVFRFYPKTLPIERSKLNRCHTLALLACHVVNRNLIQLVKQIHPRDFPIGVTLSKSLENRTIEEDLTADLKPLREFLGQTRFMSLSELEIVPPEIKCIRLDVTSQRLRTFEHLPASVCNLKLSCNNLRTVLGTLPSLHGLTELTLTGNSLLEGLPECFSRLTTLKALQLICPRKNPSFSFPKLKRLKHIKTLTRLEYLQFLELKINIKEETLSHLTALKTLKLGLCKISFSKCIIPANLAEVAIWNCHIRSFTLTIPNQNQLRTMSISTFEQNWNPPPAFVNRLGTLPNLEFSYARSE